MLEDSGAPALITRERWLGLFPGTVQAVCLDRDADLLATKSSVAPGVFLPLTPLPSPAFDHEFELRVLSSEREAQRSAFVRSGLQR